MEIKPATEADIPAILEILNYEILNSTVIYDYEPHSLKMQLDWFHKKQEEQMPVIVAVENHEILGFATFGIFRPKVAYQFSVEHSIYLSKDCRGRGVGSMLMQELIHLARQAGYHTMIAGIDTSNKMSYDFHKKLGFVEVAHFKEVGYKFNRWLDLIFMQLFLDK
ncbi:MAG: N-acetyltransferase [Saprospiraceae bacterium]|nr:N-acetyltransferase [Saprospiraceae bacterium]